MLASMKKIGCSFIQAAGFLIALQGSFCMVGAWAAGIQITPPIVEVIVAKGQTTNGTIEVQNESDQATELDVYMQDWEYLDGGSGDKLFSP